MTIDEIIDDGIAQFQANNRVVCISEDSVEYLKNMMNRLNTIEMAIDAFIGQSGEYDGYLGCYAIHKINHQHCQMGDVVRNLDELIEWYEGLQEVEHVD